MTRPTCFSCLFFQDGYRWETGAAKCVRHAPVFTASSTGMLTAAWPMVSASDWCGDYEFAGEEMMDEQAPGRWRK